jgi:hypothetical protein
MPLLNHPVRASSAIGVAASMWTVIPYERPAPWLSVGVLACVHEVLAFGGRNASNWLDTPRLVSIVQLV